MKHRFLLLVCCLLTYGLWSQNPTQNAVDQLAKEAALQYGQLGVAVIDVQTGRVVASYDAEKSLIPASIQKVFTTASAIGLLGADFTFKTELQYGGKLGPDGVLQGNIYIRGYGDPTLGSDQMEEAADLPEVMEKMRISVQQKGIRRIEGRVVGDPTWLGTEVNGRGWPWVDLGNYYGAGAWGLNIHENLYYLRFQQRSRLGDTPPIVEVEPAIPGLEFRNELSSAGANTGDNAYIYGAPRTYDRTVRGTIPVGSRIFSIKGSIPDPPLFAAQHLQQQLQSVGIISSDKALNYWDLPPAESHGNDRQLLYTHFSPALSEIVQRANMKSVNLYCEALIRAIGQERGDEGSPDGGIEAAEAFWKDRGLPADGCFFQDGSGLARTNAATSLFFARLLTKIARDERIYKPMYNSLPIAGQSGGMRYALRGTGAAGKVRAKTGTLNRVRSLAGYITARSGRQLAFCIITNNFTGSGGVMRKKMENLILKIWESN
ncbi:D-alanyl-D-alanine carboxypeptidase/D-alanyl-D-alanine endopeptidase [Flavilitoribacter nigricans]|uniref:D-alanyl-D-alanine carboxypeptidase/D-alanyl-D-alanine-endopeptidase n=1 Tax=Flavilitoribacter nigricans (strain ATCC 23147 / DSM 23189 / NBRC 102662 / NCIMB 1420 / SS-2) TaxID=1122177 RepID=A0A2D0N627_FLAN2|nr:D-alanyl-D-alanine carboxypeptidase/D-alanyl-D-alanine-endopeptidase [Flavilitoribacter nigricans]PHN03954.1 D-alanyl-D-alanine carboxypeptidase/D-alanyl-D-alanine-endopeptidase [Flavilitoribacter nigricans DSM 23189 = NBRC 102662]